MKAMKAPLYYIRKINFLYTQYRALFEGYFGWSYDDFVSELTIVYYKAINKHDPAKSALTTFIINCMKNHIIDKYRETTRDKRASLTEFDTISPDGSNLSSIRANKAEGASHRLTINSLIDPDDPESELIMREGIADKLSAFEGRERELLNLLVNEQATAQEIALYWDVDESEVYRMITSMEKKYKRIEANGKRSLKSVN